MESVCLGQTTGSIIVTSEDPGRRLAAILTANVGGQSQLAGTDEDGTQADLLVRSKSWLGADHAACASSAPLARGSITSRIRGRGLRSWLGINDDAAGKGESQATRTERSDIRGAGMLVRQETVVLRRRLTAVMLADVVNYSRMMSRSEEETHTRFAGHARELIDPTINKYGGRLVRSMGDGLLVEFVSAVDAVRCALDIQRGLAARQANEPDRMQLRIGINTGDVLVDQRDIYGNSVNIAARLEGLASPGTVCVSQSIYDQTRAQPEFFFADRGAQRVKNIPYQIHVYEVAYERIPVTLRTWLVAHWVRLAAAACIGAIAILSLIHI